MKNNSSDNHIELKAKQLLLSYSENKEPDISPVIDPIDIIEYLGYSVDYVSDKYDKNIYGALKPSAKTVEVNQDISFNEGMENFTLAHEIGHIVLHADDISDGTCSAYQNYDDNSKELEADKFAAFLLMPTNKVRHAFFSIRNKPLYLKRNFFFQFLRKTTKRKRALNFASMVIQEGNFNVSKLAMINRLIGLGLIKGLRYQKNNFNNKKGK